ncbi:hypothetical protein REPUB_Repub12eG0117000 [Reevesia pubescens]
MSQQQPRRPWANQFLDEESIKFGDVFNVTGELAPKPIGPQDAAAMPATETRSLDKHEKVVMSLSCYMQPPPMKEHASLATMKLMLQEMKASL